MNPDDLVRRSARRRSGTSPRAFEEEEILTSEEARRLLKIGRTKLWELTKRNQIPAYRLGAAKSASLRYKKSELIHWLDRNRI